MWEVVGGADKGGILVREGAGVSSPATKDRLSTGATVQELEMSGDRLKYKLIDGTGPAEGWVSIKISGKDLLVPKEEEEEIGPPGEPGAVEVDEALKAKIEAEAKKMDKDNALGAKYAFKYKVLGFPLEDPKLRVFCFHNAGSAESNYTGAGTPFTNLAKESKAFEIIALDYPGRDKMLKDTKHTSTETLAPELLAVCYSKIADGVPYVVWGHSMGVWVAFEFLILARKIGLPMPKAAFLNAFPAPHMPTKQRPWHKSARLNDEGLKQELMDWDKGHFTGPGKVVYDEPGWKDTWAPLMRADFRVFDEYKFKHTGVPKFEFPIHAWHMEGEHYNKADMIEMWKDWTTGEFDHCTMEGMGHLTCFYNPANKKKYFQKVADNIKVYAGL